MNASNELHCSTRPTSLAAIHDFLDRCLASFDPDGDWLHDVHIIADELASNIEKYAYGSNHGTYVVRLTVDGRCITVEFEDTGREFDPTAVEQTPIDGDHERPVGKLGILLVANLVDSMSYSRRGGHNVTTVVLRVPQKNY